MADDELFENLDDFGDLDEEPSFGLVEDEFPLDLMEPEPEGLSRTFKIVGALMALAVLAIIVLLVYFALGDQDKLSPNEKTSTAVAQLNQTIEAEYNATLTALAAIEAATQTAVYNAELTATAEFFVRQTEQAIAATDAALTATAEFAANQALAAAQTATQDALNQNLTATAEANRLVGIVLDEQGTIFGNVTLRLYRDDGDGVFTPADRTPAPPQAPAGATGLVYNEPVEGTLETGQTVTWPFDGAAGDVVTVEAVAVVEGLDLFAELVGPDGVLLAGDDDSGEGTNPRIASVALPASGQYTVRVSSVAGAGGYTLTVTSEASSTAHSAQPASGIVLVQAGGVTPTPEISVDELIAVITTATDGTFDFGSLEPGDYWLELDYDSLPPALKALVPAGEPLVIKVTVPVAGEVTFTIGAPPPTVTPTPTATPTEAALSPFERTATAFAGQIASLTAAAITPSLTSETAVPTETPAALPTTGFFSDIGDQAGAIGGTSGLTLLAIAAAGLVAVVFIARKLRTAT
ncbi:MAG: hypothetical protein OZ934_09375 [Anaerolineae bacterium]|nr:hypothetical protein [Anaerolineae bacterium]